VVSLYACKPLWAKFQDHTQIFLFFKKASYNNRSLYSLMDTKCDITQTFRISFCFFRTFGESLPDEQTIGFDCVFWHTAIVVIGA